MAVPAFLLVAYLFWEFYWYTQVGLIFIKWHTHLMLYVYLGMVTALVFKLFGQNPSSVVKNVFLALGSVIFSLFIAEAFLSISGSYKTYIEEVSGGYVSPYDPLMKNQYHIWPAGEPHWLHKPEYRYWRSVNSMGFADPEWRVTKKPGEKRILTLGDSFTEGDGAPFDSSYVSLMRRILSTSSDSFYIMNAGTCGSDPFYNFMNLRDRLLKYKPDIVIQSIGTNDMNPDILVRGGMERFKKDGSLQFRPGPWWEPLYAISYVSRIFFRRAGYDQMLQKQDAPMTEKGRINKSVEYLFRSYAVLCRENNVRFFVVLHPDRDETEKNSYFYDFTPIVQNVSSDPSIKVIDLLPAYRTYIASSHTHAGDYYWKKDGHHNSKGYRMMAETTLQNILPLIIDSTQVK